MKMEIAICLWRVHEDGTLDVNFAEKTLFHFTRAHMMS